MWKITARMCDECGAINPPIFQGNKRLCGKCAKPGGCYREGHPTLGANGKLITVTLRWPFKWIGWWR